MTADTEPRMAYKAILHLDPLNATFTAKQIQLDDNCTIQIGRKLNAKTIPDVSNAFFDAKVIYTFIQVLYKVIQVLFKFIQVLLSLIKGPVSITCSVNIY
jgi:hypothetical protein